MISMTLRLNSMLPPRERIRQVIAQLTGIGGARSVGFGVNKVRSLPDAVARVLSTHYNFSVNGKVEDKEVVAAVKAVPNGEMADMSNGSAKQNTNVQVNIDTMNVQQLTLESGAVATASTHLYDICPECGSASFAYEEGCKKCYGCGYSEC
jgi:ribonucleoside-diphosphate reductase alpha chain